MTDYTMGDILSKINSTILGEHAGPDFQHDNTKMVELQPNTPTVDRMLDKFNRQWAATAAECIKRAEELEDAATDLRERANHLHSVITLTGEVKAAVLFEIASRNRAASLTLVNPQED